MNKKRLFVLLFIFVCAVVIGLCIFRAPFITSTSYLPSFRETQSMKEWFYQAPDGHEVYISTETKISGVSMITIASEFRQNGAADAVSFGCIGFYSMRQAVAVTVNGSLAYHYGSPEDVQNGNLHANVFCIVDIHKALSEADFENPSEPVRIEIDFVSSTDCIIPDINLGSGAALFQNHIMNNFPMILFLVFSLLIVILFMLFGVYAFLKKIEFGSYFVYFIVFILLTCIWIFAESGILVLFFQNSSAMVMLSYQAFMLMFVPLLMFANQACAKGKLFSGGALILLLLNWAVLNVLDFMNIASFTKTIFCTHITQILALFIAVICFAREFRREKSVFFGTTLLGMTFLFVFSLVEVFAFYSNPMLVRHSSYFQYGTVVFILAILAFAFNFIVNLAQQGAKSDVYYKMAHTDPLTGIGNRMAFDKEINDAVRTEKAEIRLGVTVIDLNNLKLTNDTEGHQAGDSIIIGVAQCIEKAFAGRAKNFRTGGDEFVSLFIDTDVDMDFAASKIRNQVQEYNAAHPYPISMALGVAVDLIDASNPQAFYALTRLADDRMYEEKKNYHKNK